MLNVMPRTKDIPFAQLPQATTQDSRIAGLPYWMLTILRNQAPGFQLNADQIAKLYGLSRYAARKAMGILRECRYVYRHQYQNELGEWGTDNFVFDRPASPEEIEEAIAQIRARIAERKAQLAGKSEQAKPRQNAPSTDDRFTGVRDSGVINKRSATKEQNHHQTPVATDAPKAPNPGTDDDFSFDQEVIERVANRLNAGDIQNPYGYAYRVLANNGDHATPQRAKKLLEAATKARLRNREEKAPSGATPPLTRQIQDLRVERSHAANDARSLLNQAQAIEATNPDGAAVLADMAEQAAARMREIDAQIAKLGGPDRDQMKA